MLNTVYLEHQISFSSVLRCFIYKTYVTLFEEELKDKHQILYIFQLRNIIA